MSEVLATGILLRLATDDEARRVEAARRGGEFALEPSRSFKFTEPDRPAAADEVYVVSQAFVDLGGGEPDRWTGWERHGHAVPTSRDATLELLALARETAADLIDLLGDMRIAGVDVSRWELMSASHRIELAPELEGLVSRSG